MGMSTWTMGPLAGPDRMFWVSSAESSAAPRRAMPEPEPDEGKHPDAVGLGRLGRLGRLAGRGKQARAEKLSAKKMSAIAKRAAKERRAWSNQI